MLFVGKKWTPIDCKSYVGSKKIQNARNMITSLPASVYILDKKLVEIAGCLTILKSGSKPKKNENYAGCSAQLERQLNEIDLKLSWNEEESLYIQTSHNAWTQEYCMPGTVDFLRIVRQKMDQKYPAVRNGVWIFQHDALSLFCNENLFTFPMLDNFLFPSMILSVLCLISLSLLF